MPQVQQYVCPSPAVAEASLAVDLLLVILGLFVGLLLLLLVDILVCWRRRFRFHLPVVGKKSVCRSPTNFFLMVKWLPHRGATRRSRVILERRSRSSWTSVIGLFQAPNQHLTVSLHGGATWRSRVILDALPWLLGWLCGTSYVKPFNF